MYTFSSKGKGSLACFRLWDFLYFNTQQRKQQLSQIPEESSSKRSLVKICSVRTYKINTRKFVPSFVCINFLFCTSNLIVFAMNWNLVQVKERSTKIISPEWLNKTSELQILAEILSWRSLTIKLIDCRLEEKCI